MRVFATTTDSTESLCIKLNDIFTTFVIKCSSKTIITEDWLNWTDETINVKDFGTWEATRANTVNMGEWTVSEGSIEPPGGWLDDTSIRAGECKCLSIAISDGLATFKFKANMPRGSAHTVDAILDLTKNQSQSDVFYAEYDAAALKALVSYVEPVNLFLEPFNIEFTERPPFSPGVLHVNGQSLNLNQNLVLHSSDTVKFRLMDNVIYVTASIPSTSHAIQTADDGILTINGLNMNGEFIIAVGPGINLNIRGGSNGD